MNFFRHVRRIWQQWERPRLPLPQLYHLYRLDPSDMLMIVQQGSPLAGRLRSAAFTENVGEQECLFLTTLRAANPQQAVLRWMQILQTRAGVSVEMRSRYRGVWTAELRDPFPASGERTLSGGSAPLLTS